MKEMFSDKDEKDKKKVSKQRSEVQATDRQAGATKRSGQNILRKAKLQLNKYVSIIQIPLILVDNRVYVPRVSFQDSIYLHFATPFSSG